MRIAHNLRLAAILALGAFALHQLRYLLAFDGSAAAAPGHGYMTDLLAPMAVLVLAAALTTVFRGTEGASPAGAPLARRTLVFATVLLGVHFGQESVDAIVTVGNPAGVVAAIAAGAWIALPLGLIIGALAAVVARALEAFERAIAVAHMEHRVRSRPPAVRGRALPARGPRLASSPLAFGLARRPPPALPA